MPGGLFGDLPRRAKRLASAGAFEPFTPEEEEMARRQGVRPEDIRLDQLDWRGAADGLFADEEPAGGGALASVAPARKAHARDLGDNLGLIGATLADVGSGLRGGPLSYVNDWNSREKAQNDEADWLATLDGMEMDPLDRELAESDKGAFLAATFGEKQATNRYDRQREDIVEDRDLQRTWDVDDRDTKRGWDVDDRDVGLVHDMDKFLQSLDLDRDQFGETVRHNKAVEGLSAEEIEAKREADAAKNSGDAIFDGPQLANIYNKNMDALDGARTAQQDLDTIATSAQQFLDKSKQFGDWGQGSGAWQDLWQATSMQTSDLKALTDRIAPIMRKPGSGSSSDKDVEMFKSSVVSVNNTPAANALFAQGAVAMANRNREYVNFLNDMIDPRDPQSRQKADKIWSTYKDEQRLFDDTGALRPDVKSFADWAKSLSEEPDDEADDVADLLEKYR